MKEDTQQPCVEMPADFPCCRSLGGGVWVLAESWLFGIDGRAVVVPPGFQCDLYSAPWVVRPVIPQDERDNRPALVHDMLYATVGLRERDGAPAVLDRARCDEALYVAMRMCGFGWLRARAIWSGVRAGGWVPWGKLERAGYSMENPCMGRLISGRR